jgi:hypothetical protein
VIRDPWFRRVWILQEATISSNLIFQHGFHTVSLGALHAANLCAYNEPLQIRSEGLSLIRKIGSLRRRCNSFREELKMSYLLRMSRHCKTSDDRDKIYGLPGILRAKRHIKGHPNPESEYGLLPDYSKSAEQLFIEVAMFLIDEERSLNAFRYCCAGISTSKYKLPSRTQDLSGTHPDCYRNFDPWFERPDRSALKYKAALGYKPNPRIFLDETAMVLTGILFDTVQETTFLTHTADSLGRPCSETWAEWRAFALKQPQQDPYSEHASKREILWRTMSQDQDLRSVGRKRASDPIGDLYHSWLEGEDTTHIAADNIDEQFLSKYGSCDTL